MKLNTRIKNLFISLISSENNLTYRDNRGIFTRHMINEGNLTIERDPNGYLKYPTDPGCFFVYEPVTKSFKNDKVYSCRETFSKYFVRKDKYLGYISRKVINIEALAKLWYKIETKLGINNRRRSLFFKVNENVIIIKPCRLWFRNYLTRGFFTLFLRCFTVYNRGNLSKSIHAYDLARSVDESIKLFLSGHIRPYVRDFCSTGIVRCLNPHNHDSVALSQRLLK